MRAVVAGVVSLSLVATGLIAQAPPAESDTILRAMKDELERSRALKVVDLDKPYYIEYSLEDSDFFTVSASLGALISANRNRARVPQVQVRVGDYQFDNTNHIYSSYYSGQRYDPDQWPLDNNYALFRECFWLATDRAYKAGLEALSRKRAALKNAAQPEPLADFSKAPAVKVMEPIAFGKFDEADWANRVVRLSQVFTAYPELHSSTVSSQVFRGVAYFVDSEGTVARYPDSMVQLYAAVSAQAADGMAVRDLASVPVLEASQAPADGELRRVFTQSAENVRSLLKAPIGEGYTGPVLFEGVSAAQLMAQLVGDNLRVPRRPISDPNRPAPILPSEFETKLGARVMPDWMDVVDDATQKEWRGRKLLGYTVLDMEGVQPKPVNAVEKGVLKSFITTRQPVKGSNGSTGNARLGGSFGTRTAVISNLFVKASQTKSPQELRAQLIESIKQRGKPYGIIVRKLDYPTAASPRELQAMLSGLMQGGGGGRPVSPPVLVYRVYPDGKEELVRGLRFRGLNSRSLRDIVAASDEQYVFDFINNGAPFAVSGAGGYVAPSTVVSPALLFDEVELEREQEGSSRPPLAPPPPM